MVATHAAGLPGCDIFHTWGVGNITAALIDAL